MRLRSRPLHSRIFIYRVYIYVLYAFWLIFIPFHTAWKFVAGSTFSKAFKRTDPSTHKRVKALSENWLFRSIFLFTAWFVFVLAASFVVPTPVFDAPASALPSNEGVAKPKSELDPLRYNSKLSADKVGFLTFGPHLNLPAGLYRVRMNYTYLPTMNTPTSIASHWDLVCASSGMLRRQNVFMSGEQGHVIDKITFSIRPIQNLEFRSYFGRDGTLAIHRVIVEHIGPRSDIFRARKVKFLLHIIIGIVLLDGFLVVLKRLNSRLHKNKNKRHG